MCVFYCIIQKRPGLPGRALFGRCRSQTEPSQPGHPCAYTPLFPPSSFIIGDAKSLIITTIPYHHTTSSHPRTHTRTHIQASVSGSFIGVIPFDAMQAAIDRVLDESVFFFHHC